MRFSLNESAIMTTDPHRENSEQKIANPGETDLVKSLEKVTITLRFRVTRNTEGRKPVESTDLASRRPQGNSIWKEVV